MFETDLETKDKLKKKNKKEKKQKPVRLFPANKKGYHIMHTLNFFRFLLYPWNSIFYPCKMFGHKTVGQGAYIYVGNHYSMWDIFYPARTTKEGVHYVAKESITSAPVLRRWALKIGAITAMRDGSDIRALTDAMKCLKNGEKVVLFPEGTRNKVSEDEFLPFHGGSALMSIKTKTPIIPFVICNKPKVFKKVHVVFGEPFELSEYYDRKLSREDYEEAERIIVNKMYDIREAHRAYLRERKAGKKKKCKS